MRRRSRPSHINTVYVQQFATSLTALCGSFPHKFLANSSPAMLRHHLVCFMQSLGTATFKHSSSRPMSCKHSRAAMLVICDLGVSAVLGVDAIIIPFKSRSRSTSSSGSHGEVLPFCARKHARAAPVGPAPMINRSVLGFDTNRSILQHSWCLALALDLCIGVGSLEFSHDDAHDWNIKEDCEKSRKSVTGRLFRPY